MNSYMTELKRHLAQTSLQTAEAHLRELVRLQPEGDITRESLALVNVNAAVALLTDKSPEPKEWSKIW